MWFTSIDNSDSVWESYYDPSSDSVFKKVSEKSFKKFNTLRKHQNICKTRKFPSDIVENLPSLAYPIDTYSDGEDIFIVTPIKNQKSKRYNIPITQQINAELSGWDKLIESNIQLACKNPIKAMFEYSTVYIATDGSIKNHSNSFAAIFSSEDTIFLHTQGHVWNNNIQSSPARSVSYFSSSLMFPYPAQ